MDQHLEEAAALNFLLSEDTTSSALPVMSPSEIDGYLAELENRPPLAPFSESLLDGQTTGTSVNHENDIIMQALQEAEITPLHDLEELKRELAEEQAKNKQLSGHLKNQYSKISRLRKTYQDHLQAAENEHFRSARANQQHLEEKKKLQENVLALTGQVEVYKRELEASKSEAQHHEKLLRERDRAFQALKAELKTIQAKLKGLINERIFVFCE